MLESRRSKHPSRSGSRTTWVAVLGAVVAVTAAAASPASVSADAAPGLRHTASGPATGLARIDGGVRLGLSLAQHQGIDDPRLPYEVDSRGRRGWVGGGFLHFPVTDRFGLVTEVLYVQKGSRQAIGVTILEVPTTLAVEYDLDYLEIPSLLRYVWWRSGKLGVASLSGFAFALKLKDRYRLAGRLVGAEDEIPLRADAAMDEVDLFDFALVYGTELEFSAVGHRWLLTYRFALSLEKLALPTYAYVPFGEGEQLRIDNDPVPLRNQAHGILLGIRF